MRKAPIFEIITNRVAFSGFGIIQMIIIRTRKEGRIWSNIDRVSVAVTKCGEISRAIVSYNPTCSKHRFVMETELRLGTGQEVVCGKAKEDEIIGRMDQSDCFWGSW